MSIVKLKNVDFIFGLKKRTHLPLGENIIFLKILLR